MLSEQHGHASPQRRVVDSARNLNVTGSFEQQSAFYVHILGRRTGGHSGKKLHPEMISAGCAFGVLRKAMLRCVHADRFLIFPLCSCFPNCYTVVTYSSAGNCPAIALGPCCRAEPQSSKPIACRIARRTAKGTDYEEVIEPEKQEQSL